MQQYPDNLKTSKAIPLLKQDKPADLQGSYRLINLLPSLGKLIDKVTGNQVLNYLKVNDLIPHSHHGGRPQRSTVTALATMLDKWTESYENKKELAIIVLDQSAAYNMINHDLLISKMKILEFQDQTLNYFRSYLSRRCQAILVDRFKSDKLYIEKLSHTRFCIKLLNVLDICP